MISPEIKARVDTRAHVSTRATTKREQELQEEIRLLKTRIKVDWVDQVIEVGKLQAQNKKLVEALEKIITISDRKHDAWDEAKSILQEIDKVLEN